MLFFVSVHFFVCESRPVVYKLKIILLMPIPVMSALAHRCIARCGSDELVLSLSCLTLLYIHILILVLLLPTAYRRRALTVAPTRRTWRRLSSMCTACTPTRLSWQQGFPWEGKAVPLSNSRYKWSSHCLRALDVSSRDAESQWLTCIPLAAMWLSECMNGAIKLSE